MSRSPLVFPLLLVAGAGLTASALGQQGAPPPVDPAAVLATLKELRTRQPAVVNREKTSVLAALSEAMADPGKAYEAAVAAVDLQVGSNEGARTLEIRKRQAELLRNRDFVNGLHLQLVYLALTWQHQMGVKTADLLAPLLDYTGQVAVQAETFTSFDPLRKNVGETAFALYFQMTPYFAGMLNWSERPFDVEGIYEKTILPELRLEKDPRLLAYWDNHIQAESARAEASRNPLVINKFKLIRLPSLLWSRAEDEAVLGRENQAVADMLALVKAHPDHPDFEKWASGLEGIVSPPSPSPATSPAVSPAPPP